jgi:hypothetical protein
MALLPHHIVKYAYLPYDYDTGPYEEGNEISPIHWLIADTSHSSTGMGVW